MAAAAAASRHRLHGWHRPSRRPHSYECRAASTADVRSSSHVSLVKRSVSGNEHIAAPGSVVVLGDVDGSIECGGSVCVWGRLSGHVHAGCEGETSATVSALEFRGAQLVIANVTSLGAARVTVPGPHTVSVSAAGSSLAMHLTPLGPAHPPVTATGLTTSLQRWLQWYPACAAALVTGCYALLAGVALMVAPTTVLGLLFDTSSVAPGWIRLGGVLFATFGGQYLGTAISDWRTAVAAGSSSSGCPDMPFRPASPHPPDAASPAAPPVAAKPAGGSAAVRSAPASQVSRDDVAQLRRAHTAAATGGGGADSQPQMPAEAAAASDSSSSSASWLQAILGQKPAAAKQEQHGMRPLPPPPPPPHHHWHPQQQQQQAPTWALSSIGFYEASVWARLGLAAAFTVLAACRCCQPGVLVLAVVNLFGALSMLVALRRQWLLHVMHDDPSLMRAAAS